MIIRFVPDFLVSRNTEAFTEICPRGGISHHPTITPGPNPPENGGGAKISKIFITLRGCVIIRIRA